MNEAMDYMREMRNAIGTKLIDPDFWIYNGKEGHERFAREFGYALNDFSEKEQYDILQGSYSSVYVIACRLKPILNANEWIAQLKEGKAKKAR